MGWDLATPFIIDLQVGAEDIDGLGHANNAVYVSWLERCAWRHSQRLGLDLTEYRRLDRAMAVVRHEIDYLAAGYEGDELQLATWIVDWDQRLKMTRRFQLVRPEALGVAPGAALQPGHVYRVVGVPQAVDVFRGDLQIDDKRRCQIPAHALLPVD